ncbi:MAG: hypothetical protein Q9M97_02980 [Candidatus Gracilibacteria bacterium]|nr:hypothetical protein [Candidatus Gracilibacteria bacterium]
MKVLLIFTILIGIIGTTNTVNAEIATVTLGDGTRVYIDGNDGYWAAVAVNTYDFEALGAALMGLPDHDESNSTVTATTISCTNGVSITMLPPLPTYSFSSSTCSSYTYAWDETWGNCSINGDWSTNGEITCGQTSTWSRLYSACGVQTTTTTETCDVYGNCTSSSTTSSCNRNNCNDVSRPANRSTIKTISMNLNSTSSNTCDDGKYANNSDTCSLGINISGSTNQDKSITGLSGKEIKNIFDTSGEPSNRIDGGGEALNFDSVPNSSISGNGTSFNFNISGIKAVSPFDSNNGSINFKVEGLNNFTTLTLNNIDYDFSKPYTGDIDIDGDELKFGTEQTLKLDPSKSNCANCTGEYTISNYSGSLDVTDSIDFTIQNINGESDLSGFPLINSTINFIGTGLMGNTELKTNPHISYSLGGQDVKYVLGKTNNSTDDTYIISGTS